MSHHFPVLLVVCAIKDILYMLTLCLFSDYRNGSMHYRDYAVYEVGGNIGE